MRLRVERKLRKVSGKGSAELLAVVMEREQGHYSRGEAAKWLLRVGDRRGADWLLTEFFRVDDEIAVIGLALAIEKTKDGWKGRPISGAGVRWRK